MHRIISLAKDAVRRNGMIVPLFFLWATVCSAQPSGRIFYSSFSPQGWDIYLSHDSGKTLARFTDHPALDYDAVISPDGRWVVFTSERSGVPKLYVKALQGDQAPALLLDSDSFQDQAAFSPDGRTLAFVSSHEGNADIYLVPFLPDSVQDISTARNLTQHAGGDFRPSFSPDGTRIAFCSDRGHAITPHPQFPFARQRTGDIYSVGIRGDQLQRLTTSDQWDGSPTWSPDGSRIIFYTERLGEGAIFEMRADGSDQKRLFEFSGPAVSPKFITKDLLAFTTWRDQRDFRLMQVNLTTKKIAPLIASGPGLQFHTDGHPDGIMVFHGGDHPSPAEPPGIFGFDGDVLAALPDSLHFAEQHVNIYAVRRAFVAPPLPGTTLLVYDASDTRNLFEHLRPMGYSVFWLPLLMLALFVAGILMGIRHRKTIPGKHHFLFSGMVILTGLATGLIFLYVDTIRPLSVPAIRLVMGALMLAWIGAGWWQHRRASAKREMGNPQYRIAILYSLLFFGLAAFSGLCALFINHMVHDDLHFYQVDYRTGEKTPLFSLEKEWATNPANFSVLDSKVTHDGQSLLFTTGNFRAGARTQGDIWKYDLSSKTVEKLADSPDNDGFADISEDGKLVFRTGRTGHFDICLSANGRIIPLTQDHHRDNFPAISKSGDKIVFSSDRARGDQEYKTMDIFLMTLNADSSWSAPEKISAGDGQHAHAHFSPDGEWVIYATEAYGINDEQPLIQPLIFSPQMYGEIVAYRLSTGERIRLTHNKWEDGAPLWVD